MLKQLLSVYIFLFFPLESHAHWVWIFPDASDASKVNVVFAHRPAASNAPKLLDRISHATLWVRKSDGDERLKWTRGEGQYAASNVRRETVGGTNDYGVVTKPGAPPFRLIQCPKLALADDQPWEKLPFEFVPKATDGIVRLAVMFRGQPALAGLAVTVHSPDEKKLPVLSTDENGEVEFKPTVQGIHGFTVAHTVPESGEDGGVKYEETRYSASLVLQIDRLPPASGPDR